jgi:hypothetical protein
MGGDTGNSHLIAPSNRFRVIPEFWGEKNHVEIYPGHVAGLETAMSFRPSSPDAISIPVLF